MAGYRSPPPGPAQGVAEAGGEEHHEYRTRATVLQDALREEEAAAQERRYERRDARGAGGAKRALYRAALHSATWGSPLSGKHWATLGAAGWVAVLVELEGHV